MSEKITPTIAVERVLRRMIGVDHESQLAFAVISLAIQDLTFEASSIKALAQRRAQLIRLDANAFFFDGRFDLFANACDLNADAGRKLLRKAGLIADCPVRAEAFRFDAFLHNLRRCGVVSRAASLARLSRQAIYRHAAENPEFARRWEEAEESWRTKSQRKNRGETVAVEVCQAQ